MDQPEEEKEKEEEVEKMEEDSTKVGGQAQSLDSGHPPERTAGNKLLGSIKGQITKSPC